MIFSVNIYFLNLTNILRIPCKKLLIFTNSHRKRTNRRKEKKKKVRESDVVGCGEDPRGDRMGGNLCVA